MFPYLKSMPNSLLRLIVFVLLSILASLCSLGHPEVFGVYLFLTITLTVISPEVRQSYAGSDPLLVIGSLALTAVGFVGFLSGFAVLLVGVGVPALFKFAKTASMTRKQQLILARSEAQQVRLEARVNAEPKPMTNTLRRQLARREKNK
jgi:hypothetical protein